MTTSGFRTEPQSTQRRERQERDDLLAALGTAARDAARGGDRAVHLDHVARAGTLVQAVDVLGDHRLEQARALEGGERQMAGVRLDVGEHAETAAVELPGARRVEPEAVDRRDLVRVVLGPDPGRAPEVRHAALGARCRRRSARRTAGSPRSVLRPSPPHAWLQFLNSDPCALRRDRRAGDRAQLELPRLVRGGARRVPRAVRGRLPAPARPRGRGARARVARPLPAADEVRRAAASCTRAASTCAERASASSTRSSARVC